MTVLEPDSSVSVEKLEDEFAAAADKHLEGDESAVDAMKSAVGSLTSVLEKLNSLLESHEFDLIESSKTAVGRPIVERAAAVKKEIDQVKVCWFIFNHRGL